MHTTQLLSAPLGSSDARILLLQSGEFQEMRSFNSLHQETASLKLSYYYICSLFAFSCGVKMAKHQRVRLCMTIAQFLVMGRRARKRNLITPGI